MRNWGVLWCLVLLGGCAERQVTLHGTPVADEGVKTAAHAIALAETVLAAVPGFLIRGHQQGRIPLPVLEEYVRVGLPAAQEAGDTARTALLTYATTPTPTASTQLQGALTALQSVVARATLLLQQYEGP